MIKQIIGAAALMIIIGASAQASSHSQQAETYLGMLSGCWRGEFDGTVVEERWDKLAGGLMLGTAKTVAGDAAVEFEFLKIRVNEGDITYTPYINGTEASAFRLNEAASNATKLVFENPQNDFPKKITYAKSGSALDIELTGESEGGAMNVRYTLNSLNCAN